MDKALAPASLAIDVPKHRLDIRSRPSGERLTIDRDEEGVTHART